MKRDKKLQIILAIVMVAATIASMVSTAIVYFEKRKKDATDLEKYLDGSIL